MKALRKAKGDRTQAAKILGISKIMLGRIKALEDIRELGDFQLSKTCKGRAKTCL